MGGSGSTRRLVIEEDDEEESGFFVQISDSVARQIFGKSEKDSLAKDEHVTGENSSRQPEYERGSTKSTPSERESLYNQRESLYRERDNVLLEKKRAIQEVDELYKKKMKILDEKNAVMHKVNTEQFQKAVEEVEKKFLKQTGFPVCKDWEQKVMECYQYNLSQPLHCSSQVRGFTACIDSFRQTSFPKVD